MLKIQALLEKTKLVANRTCASKTNQSFTKVTRFSTIEHFPHYLPEFNTAPFGKIAFVLSIVRNVRKGKKSESQSLYLNLSFRTRISASICARSSSFIPSLPFSIAIAFSSASSPVRRNGL